MLELITERQQVLRTFRKGIFPWSLVKVKTKSNAYCERTGMLGASEELVEELSSASSKIPIGTSARVQKIKVSSKKQML